MVAFPTHERLPTTPHGTLTAPSGDDGANDWIGNFTHSTSSHGGNKNGSAVSLELRRLLVSLGVQPAGLGAGDGQPIPSSHTGTSSKNNSKNNANHNSSHNSSSVNSANTSIPILVEGVVVGSIRSGDAAAFVSQLRYLKSNGGIPSTNTTTSSNSSSSSSNTSSRSRGGRIDPTMEVAYMPLTSNPGAYPGIYLFTQPGRMIRPVMNLFTRKVEWLGPMEQV